jgi:hypothetical protein
MCVQPRKSQGLLKSYEALVIALCFIAASCCLASTTQHEAFTNAVPFVTAGSQLNTVQGLDTDKATLDNPAAAMALIQAMSALQKGGGVGSGTCPLTGAEKKLPAAKERSTDCLPELTGKQEGVYVLIHLLSWAPSKAGAPDPKPKVAADNWYLYRDIAPGKWSQEDFTSAKRLQGIKRIYVLLLQFNAKSVIPDGNGSYVPDYDFTIAKKTPANVAHLYSLLQAFTGGNSAGSGTAADQKIAGFAQTAFDSVWSGGVLNVEYIPSDILIKSTFHVSKDDSDQKLADDITFDNEGPYYWDVGFAVPVKKISQLKLDTTSGTATPANVGSETVFALLDGYFKPVDVKGSGFTAIPHPIAGVAFAKRPLSQILLGGAWGPKASEIYLGAMFVKQPELSGNSSCSSASGTSLTGMSHYCAQFTIGLNLSVSAIASKLGAPK